MVKASEPKETPVKKSRVVKKKVEVVPPAPEDLVPA